MKKNKKEKKKYAKKQIGFGILLGVTVLAGIYIGMAVFFQTHFCFGTTVDGIPVGGLNAARVEQLIKGEIDSYRLKLLKREGEPEEISGADISIRPVFDGEVAGLIEEQNAFAWIAAAFQGRELALARVVEFDGDALDKIIDSLECMDAANQRMPVNAGCSGYEKGAGYTLIPADYGTTVARGAFRKAVLEAISTLEDELDLDAAGCYVEPKIGDDNPKLLKVLEDLNRCVGMTVTYDFDEKKEVLDGETINEWLNVVDLELAVDEEAVSAYVKQLGKKYNTAYQSKTFETSYGETVTISGGFYGWRIDNGQETQQLIADLRAGESVEREPVYMQTANSHGETDYGDSYVEINLTAQHLFLYKDGELVVESDFVSGCVAKGHSTPTGAFGLTYKTTDAVLRGPGYATPVKYWMPFNGDVGMHDATWRRSFGGNIYKRNGSHGCINLPFDVAEKIYGNIDKGFAVLVYTLPGTESAAAVQQDAAEVVNLINSIGTVTLESETAIVSARNLYDALSATAKGYVTNYDTLVAAEAALAALKGGQQPAEQPPAEQQPAEQPQQPVEQPPAEQQPAEQQPAEGQPAEGQPTQ